MPLKEEFIAYIYQEKGACQGRTAPHADAPGLVRRQKGGEESLGQSFYWGFCGKGKTGQGTSLRLASLNNSGRLWSIGADATCLVTASGLN